MSVDKLVDSTQLDSDLTSVANAIRAKSGGSSQLAFPGGFVSEIGNIPSGGGAQVIKRQYVHAEDWLAANGETSGTLLAVSNTYCTNGDGIYIVTCENNTAQTKKFNYAYIPINIFGGDCLSRRESNTNSCIVTPVNMRYDRDLFISAGSTIMVSFISKEDLL